MLHKRQLATVLAALRYWQRYVPEGGRIHDPIASDAGFPLTDEEIDSLCEALNFAPLSR